MKVAWHTSDLALNLFLSDDPLDFIDRGCARVPGGLGVVLAKIACQLLQLDVGDIREVGSCMAGID